MAGQKMLMDAEMAESQLKILEQCQEVLKTSLASMEQLGKSQNSLLWTSDGKLPELTSELRAKYNAGVLWLRDIEKDINKAYENLALAVKETKLLDEAQKEMYQKVILAAVSPIVAVGAIFI